MATATSFLTSDDTRRVIWASVGQGELTDDELNTFGNRAVTDIPQLQGLMRYVCENGFEHHVVMNLSRSADVLDEAFSNYLEWDVYHHDG